MGGQEFVEVRWCRDLGVVADQWVWGYVKYSLFMALENVK